MQHVYNDGGRSASGFKGSAGDCVCRSIAIITGRPYSEVYKELADGRGSQRASKRSSKKPRSAGSGINTKRKWFKDYMKGQNFTWVPCMKIGTGCKVHLADGELPSGRIVVSLSKHLTAVIDGVIFDTFNPQREVDGRSSRCVYGYWILNEKKEWPGELIFPKQKYPVLDLD